MACNQTSQTCWEIAFATDFDYKHEDSSNPGKGLIYYADGVPHMVKDKVVYDLYDISHNIHCNPAATGDDIQPLVIPVFRNGEHVQFYFDWDTAYGCPTEMEKTPDVPQIPDPDCKFESIEGNSTLSRLGISVDMTLLNNGPVGIRSLFGYGDKVRLMYYTPCGYSDCPYSAKTCTDGVRASVTDTRGVSSLWICDITGEDDNQVINECVSYGDEQEQPDYKIAGDEWDGFTHTLRKGDKRKAVIHYDCEQAYPDTYVEVPGIAREYSDTSFAIDVDNEDICPHIIPYPTPSGTLCKVEKSMMGPNNNEYKINFNMLDLNHGTEGYIVKDFVLKTIPAQTKTLRFQPCGGLLCPTTSTGKGYHCDGDEDSTVWICDEAGSGMGAEYSCDQYGKFNNVSLFTTDLIDRSVMNGVTFTYTGGLHKTAEFSLKCDDSALTGSITLEKSAKVDGNTIKFAGSAKDVCAVGTGPTPTPFPVVQPVIPDPCPMPTPNPRPDNDLFIENGTHFIYIDLERVQKSVYRGDQILLMNGKTGPLYTEYSPWNKIPCPAGYVCPTGKESNVWSCWQIQDIGKTMRCHNSGDINMGVWMDKLGSGQNLDNGVMVSYEGQYSSGADFRLKCKYGKNVSTLTNLNTITTFTQGGPSGDTFEYSTTTELACPSRFNEIYVPDPTTTPTPIPNYQPSLKWESPVINGKQIKFDLNKLDKKMFNKVFIGTGDDFENVSVYFSPSQRVTCPSGFDCLPSDSVLGNAFKCFNRGVNPVCYVIGDRSYELNFMLNNESNFDDGMRVEYGGGYGGKAEVFMQFWCNNSVKAPNYEFHKVAHSYASRKIIIEVESDMACPVLQYEANSTTGGAVFLLLVFGSTILYVVFGVAITFFISGSIALPNSGFWSEFFECVKAGAIFIGTCGKTTTVAKGSYDAI